MWCFKPSLPAGPPEGEPAEWTPLEVKQWFKHNGFVWSKGLKGVDGKCLLAMSESEWTKAAGSNGATYRAQLVKQAPVPAAELEVVPTADAEHADDKPTEWGMQQQQQQTFSKTVEAPADAMDSQMEDQGTKLPIEDLRSVFTAFAQLGHRDMVMTEMDGTKFMKMARDCSLIDDTVKETDIDFIFLKARSSKDKRRINFKEFLTAIERLATKKGMPTEELAALIVAKGGPQLTLTTTPESVRLHDDRSTYTGVYKQGGPTSVDQPQDLATMLDRERTSRRTTGAGSRMSSNAGAPDASPMLDLNKSMVMSIRRTTREGSAAGPVSLHDAFVAFANFGKAGPQQAGKPIGMANSKFVKLCKECGLIDSDFDTTSADIIFSRVKSKGANTITFREFKECLKEVAKLKNSEVSDLQSSITNSGGPMLNTACV